jgi:hypothetical protein
VRDDRSLSGGARAYLTYRQFLAGQKAQLGGEGGKVKLRKKASAIALENDGRSLNLNRRLWFSFT